MGCGLFSVIKNGGELGCEKGTEYAQRCGLAAGGYAGPRAGQRQEGWYLGELSILLLQTSLFLHHPKVVTRMELLTSTLGLSP